MKIIGAVLEKIEAELPYASSKPITISELDLSLPNEGEILVKIEAAGLCHSDLSVVDGNRIRPVPMLLGHEASGKIIATGRNTTLSVGQRVVMTFLPRCLECEACKTEGKTPCVLGSEANNNGTLLGGSKHLLREGKEIKHHLGVSGFASHAVVNEKSVVAIEDDVPADIAAVLGCAVLTGGGAVLNAAKPKDGETTIIVGLGGVGMAALLTAISLAKGPVIGIDALPDKLSQALALGADAAYTPIEAIEQKITAQNIIEAAGNVRAFETALLLCASGGTLVTVGLPHPDAKAEVSPLALVAGAKTIIGSYLGSAVPSRDIPKYVELWRAGKLPVEKLISGRVSLDQINYAMDELAAGRAVRQIIDF